MPAEITRRVLLHSSAAAVATSTFGFKPRAIAAVSDDPTFGKALVFSDEFSSLDSSVWNPGRKATTFDSGYYGRSAFARSEGEGGFVPYSIIDDDQASGGKALQISAKYIGRPMNIPGYHGNQLPEFQWVSGNIQTAKPDGTILKGWREGYFEARMWFPEHPLTWPAFWLMNGRSILMPKTSLEIDIVEHKGWELDLYGSYLHEWGTPGEHHEGLAVPATGGITQGYHRYGVNIQAGVCTPYFDRRAVIDPKTGQAVAWTIGRQKQMQADNDVFWLLLTLALRTDVAYPDPLLPQHHLAHLRIDYVNVFA